MGTHGTSNGTHGAIRVTGVHDTGILGGGGHTGMPGAAGMGPMARVTAPQHKTGGILRRSSSSSSSSSSEDDGMGGCRMKGLKEKIKEKMPGGHKGNQGKATAPGAYSGMTGYTGPTSTGTTGGHGTTTTKGTHEKKRFMEKVKEKLPGQH
ncbi:water stress-inducible protein Rab21 [Setaria italica]|uniref:water stress-inducible protein Rab21 n=1 Tax=Setaria italica TaxID=4555 RepID=UPI000350A262|nr:water stress-inducible protein Rab21 [Setaria italica]XP_034569850.1 water stress-inducible protein Rab21-like [Setaria viridis]